MSTKVHIVKAMVFPVAMYRCESWTIKKADHWRTDDFELLFWRRLLRVLWTAGRSNQSILKESKPECSLEELMQKLKLQYFGHLLWRTDSLGKTLMLGKIESRRRRGRQRRRWLDDITNSVDMSVSKPQEIMRNQESLACYCPGGHRVRNDRANEQQQIADSFRWTAKGLIHTYTCIHSPPNSPSIQAAT